MTSNLRIFEIRKPAENPARRLSRLSRCIIYHICCSYEAHTPTPCTHPPPHTHTYTTTPSHTHTTQASSTYLVDLLCVCVCVCYYLFSYTHLSIFIFLQRIVFIHMLQQPYIICYLSLFEKLVEAKIGQKYSPGQKKLNIYIKYEVCPFVVTLTFE